jgi:hypothetical protein
MAAAAIEDIGPRPVVVTVTAHVGTNTVIPTPGTPMLLVAPDSPMFHDGNALLAVANNTARADRCIYAGVVMPAQPKQYLAPENIVIACVAVEGGVTAIVSCNDKSTPTAGGEVTEPATGGIAGTIVAPQAMIRPGLWQCVLQLAPPGRLHPQAASAATGTVADVELFFLWQQDD